jgi:hypothetical protein
LIYLVRVKIGGRVINPGFHFRGHAGRERVRYDGVLHKAAKIHAPKYGFVLSCEMKQPEHDLFAAIGLLDDHLEVFAPLRELLGLLEQHIGMHEDDPERVVDFMRNPRGQLSHARKPFGVHQSFLSINQLLM